MFGCRAVTGLLLAVAVGVISGVVIGFVLLVFIFACRRRSVLLLLQRINPVLFKSAVTVKAKFHYAIWFETGSKMVADRFEAGRGRASNLSATSFEPVSNQIA